MLLNLSQLRADFKATYRQNWPLASKINILIEAAKAKHQSRAHASPVGKRIKLLQILRAANISMRTLQRWELAYHRHGRDGIAPQKRGHPKKSPLPFHVIELISVYRKKYRWGSEVIQAHLREDYAIIVNRYKIDRFLNESGLGKTYPCTTVKKVKSKRKKHTKKVVVQTPGIHTQMDVKYQLHLLKNGRRAYVYNFIDHASNWSFKRAYSAIKAKNTEDFMKRLIKECPFKINRLQTDNGIEFTFKWASKHPDDPKEHPFFKLCHQEGIRHVLIPPGEKELQGLVERSHRQDDQELYSNIVPADLQEFNHLLRNYYLWRNRRRRFKKLSWLSPDRWIRNYLERSREQETLLAAA